MIYRKLSGYKKQVSVLGIGTWKMKGHRKDAVNAIKYAIDHGINFIDTAEMYETEDIVAEAIKDYNRDDIFIATKIWPDHFHYNDVINACNESLARLKTDHIDLYQLHWPNHSIDIEETMSAMEKLKDDGKIDLIGVSNFNATECQEASYAMKRYAISTNQLKYNVLSKEIEFDGTYDYCMRHDISIIAYSPLNKGLLFNDRKTLKFWRKFPLNMVQHLHRLPLHGFYTIIMLWQYQNPLILNTFRKILMLWI
ncbi:aldo/keto reductase [Acidiplasma cupricumulans]|uniref:aldo/keto reductase n=1 Tax=Acidiplasma cupricumulans TaxID=312540 RepID=UPI001585928D|nr:aldo/keto reductase [Acidiplasma cupricumulans]